ncbi:MAG: hypothetical protein BWX52_01422 [Bacteroidetes bacterium ADurb.Bin013]|nr:MAG: hypothetical protein BWX52_01422 [Bacteroidetes bacterium ADurb.Bin013]
MTRFSAFSLMEQVLISTRQAASQLSHDSYPLSDRMLATTWESLTFIWQP